MKDFKYSVGVIGLGLIGGSLGMSLRQQGVRVVAYDNNPTVRQNAQHCVSAFVDSIAKLVQEVDIIILATPVTSLPSVFASLQKCSGIERKVISDVSSVKQEVIEMAYASFGQIPPQFVPGHPISGIEKSTAEFATNDLFVDKKVLLTPVAETQQQAIDTIRQLWQMCGADVEIMDLREHDEILAMTSHLPHVLAYAIMLFLAKADDDRSLKKYIAGGMQDFTRIAASNPKMWCDICIANRVQIGAVLQQFQAELQTINNAIQAADSKPLEKLLAVAQKYKKQTVKRV